jgi:alpha-D-ribose 1-methylphosphonate 5-triphosphate synthase subunit PhnH
MSYPAYTGDEAHARESFLALMWSMTYPGRIHQLPEGSMAFQSIAKCLLDLETSYFSPDESLISMLAETGAKNLPANHAAYHFYSELNESNLAYLREAKVGTMRSPDEAATIFVGCKLHSGTRFTLCGAGIQDEISICLEGIPDAFWALRKSACRFPPGWDVYFVDGLQVLAMPRGTRVIKD